MWTSEQNSTIHTCSRRVKLYWITLQKCPFGWFAAAQPWRDPHEHFALNMLLCLFSIKLSPSVKTRQPNRAWGNQKPNSLQSSSQHAATKAQGRQDTPQEYRPDNDDTMNLLIPSQLDRDIFRGGREVRWCCQRTWPWDDLDPTWSHPLSWFLNYLVAQWNLLPTQISISIVLPAEDQLCQHHKRGKSLWKDLQRLAIYKYLLVRLPLNPPSFVWWSLLCHCSSILCIICNGKPQMLQVNTNLVCAPSAWPTCQARDPSWAVHHS